MPRMHGRLRERLTRIASVPAGSTRGLSRLLDAALATVAPLFAAALLASAPASAHAASIGVSPTLIDLKAGESVAGLSVRNGNAAQPVSVQARIVRWRQDETGDVYRPADGVVASPPITRIAPGAENLIRIVRTAKHPVIGEESYRLLVDELPEPGGQVPGVINMLIRHSVPVFFSQARATPAQPQWRITRVEPKAHTQNDDVRGWRVAVENTGDKRLRLADLALYDGNGTQVGERSGLVGYVLGHARMNFFVADINADKAHANPSDTSVNTIHKTANHTMQDINTHAATVLRLSVQSEAGLIETGLLPVVSP